MCHASCAFEPVWAAVAAVSRREKVAPRALVRLGPQTPAVCLDDRAADREAEPHAFLLRGVERLEEALGVAVLDGNVASAPSDTKTDTSAADAAAVAS